MWRLIISSVLLLSGCSWWQAGVNDPLIVDSAIKQSNTYRELGNATGFPFGGTILSAISILGIILISGKKKLKESSG